MKILYDGLVYTYNPAGGINRYFAELIGHLPPDCEPTLTTLRTRSHTWPQHSRLRVVCPSAFRPSRVSRLVSRSLVSAVERFGRFDVRHPTFFNTLSSRPACKMPRPVVLTVHDFIIQANCIQANSAGHGIDAIITLAAQKAIPAADALLCVSHATKRDLLERFSIPEERIRVTHLAAGLREEWANGPEAVPERPYFLCVGARARHKNFDGLLRAFASFVAKRPDCALCVVGLPFSADEFRLIDELKLGEHLENWGQVSDAQLAKLYRCSLALVYPSHYEGFGIPPLEAMICGTLAIVGDNSSLPEVVGDAGLRFNSRDLDALHDLLLDVYDGLPERANLLEKGRQQAAKFSWEKTAEQTFDVYRALTA